MAEHIIEAEPVTGATARRLGAAHTRSRLRYELGLFVALWQRDMLRLVRDTSRWLGVVLQPILLWLLLGSGMANVFKLDGTLGMSYLQFFYPGLLVMIVLFTTIFAMMAVIEDREQGFLQQVQTAPGSRAALVLGKTAGVATIALAQMILALVAAPGAGYSLGDTAWGTFLLTFLFGAVGLTALSFCFAWLLRSTGGYHAIMAVVLMPLWLVSGAMFPPQHGWLDVVMTLNPMAYMVDGFRHALSGGTAPVALHSPTVAVVVLAGFALLTLALAVFVSRISAGARK